jgi:antitoxin component HigA of HigAB toxin-antitoxin module
MSKAYPSQLRARALALVWAGKPVREAARELGSASRVCAIGSSRTALTVVSWLV